MRIMDIMNDTKFRPGDFDNSRYHCINCFNRKEKPPVLILMSNSSNPPHWMVIDGLKQMVYFKHGEAMDYCKQMGYV